LTNRIAETIPAPVTLTFATKFIEINDRNFADKNWKIRGAAVVCPSIYPGPRQLSNQPLSTVYLQPNRSCVQPKPNRSCVQPILSTVPNQPCPLCPTNLLRLSIHPGRIVQPTNPRLNCSNPTWSIGPIQPGPVSIVRPNRPCVRTNPVYCPIQPGPLLSLPLSPIQTRPPPSTRSSSSPRTTPSCTSSYSTPSSSRSTQPPAGGGRCPPSRPRGT
jgi:hypothetical protein